jgi:hypothetical protein
MKKLKIPFRAIFLVALLSACSGGPASQPSATVTPESDTAAQMRATLQAALPTAIGTTDLPTTRPAATLPPVFDLTRTEDNPITDGQQIIEILEALDGIQQAQPVSPGWYLMRIVDPPETFYFAFHVIDSEGNTDIFTTFRLSPEKPFLGLVEKMDDEFIYLTSEKGSSEYERYEGCCNLNDPNREYFERFSEIFSRKLASWEQPSGAQGGEWTYAGWFEEDASGHIFVIEEKVTDIKGAYGLDPDTQELRAKKTETKLIGISLQSGHQIWEITNTTLANGREVQRIYLYEREYCPDGECFPVDALDFLRENQLIDDDISLDD